MATTATGGGFCQAAVVEGTSGVSPLSTEDPPPGRVVVGAVEGDATEDVGEAELDAAMVDMAKAEDRQQEDNVGDIPGEAAEGDEAFAKSTTTGPSPVAFATAL